MAPYGFSGQPGLLVGDPTHSGGLELVTAVVLFNPGHPMSLRWGVLYLQELPLLRRDALQALHHEPAAFIVLDVGAHLPRERRVPKAVQVIILRCDTEGGVGVGRGDRAPTWIWKYSPISSRMALAFSCSSLLSIPTSEGEGRTKSFQYLSF